MDDQRRRAIAGYLEVIKGGAQSGKKVNIKRPLHPHIAYVLSPAFDTLSADSAIGAVSKHLNLISSLTSLKTRTPGILLKGPNVFSNFFRIEPSTILYAKSGIPPLGGLRPPSGRT